MQTSKRNLTLAALALTSMMASTTANAASIIKYGDTYLGVNNEGHLNVNPSTIDDLPASFYEEFGSANVGLWRAGLGDSTAPGCLCEGWGVAATYGDMRVGGGANVDSNGGAFGLTDGTFGSTDAAITSTVNFTDAPLTITHAYGRSLAEGVFQASVTIANTSDVTMTDVVYRRAMDWDIPPTEFSEYVTHSGVEANLEAVGGNVRYASDNGFASSDPRDNAGGRADTINVDFTDNGPADHGSVFDFAFGDLEAGANRTFNIFYGSADSEVNALSALASLGVNVYSLGQQSGDPETGTPATFMFAFGGVGGVEPGENAANPILPFVPAPGEFVFEVPEGGNWFDPPYAYGFEYTLEGGAFFTEVMTPDASFGFGDIDVIVDGVVVASLVPGGMFDFTTLGMDVSSFSLVGLDTLLDIADPGFATAFPTYLDWSGMADRLLMNAITATSVGVPEPGTYALFLLAVAGMVARRRAKMH